MHLHPAKGRSGSLLVAVTNANLPPSETQAPCRHGLASMPDLSSGAVCLLVRASPSAPQHVRMTRRFCSEAPQAHPNPQSPCNRGLSGTFVHCGLRGLLRGRAAHTTKNPCARGLAVPGRSFVRIRDTASRNQVVVLCTCCLSGQSVGGGYLSDFLRSESRDDPETVSMDGIHNQEN